MLSLKISEQVYAGFSVPIFQADMPNIEKTNEEISGFLLNERLQANAENYFDWSTPPDLHKRGNESVDSVVNMFANAIIHLTRMEFESDIPPNHIAISADVWGSMTRAGAVKSMMNFAPLHWRGIYFVRCGAETTIELACPYPPRPTPGTGKYARVPKKLTITPYTSTAVLFPAWVTHSIIQAPGDGLNIALEVVAGVMLTDEEKKP
jgi:hypothetical protein